MASLGHIAVGAAAARVHRPATAGLLTTMVGWSALSLMPDVDVIGFRFGVRYGDPWGHRGATHSLVFAGVIGLVIGLALRRVRLGLIAFIVVASHGVLDTLTDGGLGCALFWPFSNERYFAPWNPIPVAPIGLAFVSPRGLTVVLTELVLFGPLLFYGLFPRKRTTVAR